MYSDSSSLDAAGRLLIVTCFLVTGLCNLTKARIKDHIDHFWGRIRAFIIHIILEQSPIRSHFTIQIPSRGPRVTVIHDTLRSEKIFPRLSIPSHPKRLYYGTIKP